MQITERQRQECFDILDMVREKYPQHYQLFYRHTDGTIRLFRYSDMEYIGISPYDFPKAPEIPPELAKKVEDAKNKPAI